MNRTLGTLVIVSSLISTPALRAQTVDPSGHWNGSIEVQGTPMLFEVDLARDGRGDLGGTISVPSQQLRGLPILKITATGQSISFFARTDQTLTADLASDGRSMSGSYTVEGTPFPFTMKRTGDAQIDPPLTSAAISKELEGTWKTQTVTGTRLELRLTNQPDGRATGRLVNVDQGGLEIPLAITQNASNVSLEAKVVPGSFTGILSADAAELVGQWTQASGSIPLTLRRSGK
jgi:hypothetical protein